MLPPVLLGLQSDSAQMKAKHKQPRSKQRGQAQASPGSFLCPTRWFRSPLFLLLSIALGGAAIWFGVHSRKSAEAPGRAEPRMARVDSATASAPPRPKSRDANHQEEVVAKVNRGNQLLAEGKPAEALQVLTEAMQLNPNDEDVRYDLGLALTRLGRLDEAIQQYGEALRIFPNYAEAHNNLGNVLMRAGRTEEAISHLQLAVKIMPDYASAHNNLGTALQRAGRTNEALLHFQQAAKLKPDYWEAHFNIATSLLQAGKLDDARGEFETVLRLKPDFEPAKAALAQVETQRAGGSP
jgi:Flp pilus assembly protein TadD